MESKYTYICKLITQIKKRRTISANSIIENYNDYTNSDIMYLAIAILLNNGLLFNKKFSNYNWYIDKNEFSPFCVWSNISEDEHISLPDEEVYNPDKAEFLRILKEEEEELSNSDKADYIDEPEEELSEEEQAIKYMKDLYHEYYYDPDEETYETIYQDPYDNFEDYKLVPNPDIEKVPYNLKDKEGNISGKKIMWLLRNKCAHNQYSISSRDISLEMGDSTLELIDFDLFVILGTYLEELININTIQNLLANKGYYTKEGEITKLLPTDDFDVSKINEIISMFTLLLKEFYNSSNMNNADNADEIILDFNSHLNDIREFDNTAIEAIDNPNYDLARISVLLIVLFALSDWESLDKSSLDLTFLNVNSTETKITNLNKIITNQQNKLTKLEELYKKEFVPKEKIKTQIDDLIQKISLNKATIEYLKSNDNIIKHLRNSFAHGYYYFHGETIIIYDFDNYQKQTFSASCNINDMLNFILNDDLLSKLISEEPKRKKL